MRSSIPHEMEELVKQPPPPRGVEEIGCVRREIRQKFNNLPGKFLSPLPYGVEKLVNKLFHLTGWRSIKIVFTLWGGAACKTSNFTLCNRVG